MNISGKNLPEIRWHRPYRAVFFTEVGIRRDVATNTQPSCLVLYHLSLSPYHWRDVFSPVALPSPFSSRKTLQPLITFISRNGPLTLLAQANKEREREKFSPFPRRREKRSFSKMRMCTRRNNIFHSIWIKIQSISFIIIQQTFLSFRIIIPRSYCN